jgi:hypothetical protein
MSIGIDEVDGIIYGIRKTIQFLGMINIRKNGVGTHESSKSWIVGTGSIVIETRGILLIAIILVRRLRGLKLGC